MTVQAFKGCLHPEIVLEIVMGNERVFISLQKSNSDSLTFLLLPQIQKNEDNAT